MPTQPLRTSKSKTLLPEKVADARLLAELISKSSILIIVANAKGDITWVNDAFMALTGYTQEDMHGQTLEDLLQASMTEPDATPFNRNEGNGSFHGDITSRTKAGEPYSITIDVQPWLDKTGTLTNYIAIAQDITKQKAAVERTNRLTSELKSIFELSPDGFVAFNEYGVKSYVNVSFLKMTGLTYEQLDGITLSEFEKLISSLCLEHDSVATRPNHDGMVIKLIYPKFTVVKKTTRNAYDAENKYLGTIHYFRDITQEAELHRMKGEFLSMAAHELRTPMASIHGFTELLLKRQFSIEQQKEMLDTIYRQSTRLTNMINDLLDLAKIEAREGISFDIEPHLLSKVINTALQEFTVNAENQQIEYNEPAQMPTVAVDFDKIIQALVNVLSNAHKYSPTGSVIRLNVEEKVSNEQPYVGVVISDEGIGMTKQQLSRLFERFYRADTSGKVPGTGLGMCLVKEIMEMHLGSVEVESQFGKGTQVRLWMPKLIT